MIAKLISGGQTGVDRAALDAALRLGIPCGGWCPRGRKAEDGPIPERYPLLETDEDTYPPRTAYNVDEADAVLILHTGKITGGSALTAQICRRTHKRFTDVDLNDLDGIEEIRYWLARNDVGALMIAGPRESKSPGIYDRALAFLLEVLAP
jgi:hypothetical protein